MAPIIRLRERKGLRRRGKNHQCRASVDRCVKYYLRVVFSNGAADIMVHICTAALFTVYNMYGHTYSKSMDQPGKVANPAACGQLSRENEYFPVHVRA